MKKAIFVATIGNFFNFEKSDMQLLMSLGYEVHCAANFTNGNGSFFFNSSIKIHQVDFSRSPYSTNNIRAYKQLREIFRNDEFNIIHCHTPVGGIITRLAAKNLRNSNTKVFYTAHGFHFFNGAPVKNWVLYYPIEKICSKWTDVLITINTDDYRLAKEKMYAKKIYYIPGIGIDLEKFNRDISKRENMRKELGINNQCCMFLSVGELCDRKNHIAVIKALKSVKNENFRYYIVGEGKNEQQLRTLVSELELQDKIFLLGHRDDIQELCNACDCYIFPSIQEGLPVALMEAIACGCPVIASDIRGNRDLIMNSKYLFAPNDVKKLEELINLFLDENQRSVFEYEAEQNYIKLKEFEKTVVRHKMESIYKDNTND